MQYIFTPGPVPIAKDILEIGSEQVPYFRNQYFSDLMLQNKELLLKLSNAPKGSEVIFLTSSGTGAMEATVMNLFDKDDFVIVLNGGGFGERFVKICDTHKIKNHNFRLKHNEKIDFKALSEIKADGFLINAHETTIGRMYDLKKVAKLCKKNNLLNVVDAISCFCCDDVDMQKYNIDALIVSSNKGLALPPGLAMVILAPKALKRLKKIDCIYFDFKDYISNMTRGQTPFTPSISILRQLNLRLKQLEKIGMKKNIQKTKKLSTYFRKSIKGLPYKFYSKEMPNAMTTLEVTQKQSALEIIEIFEKRYNIVLTPSGGELKDRLIRVSHMGNMDKKYIDILVKKLKKYHKKRKK